MSASTQGGDDTQALTVGRLAAALLRLIVDDVPCEAPVDLEGPDGMTFSVGGVRLTSYWGKTGVLILRAK